MKRIWISGYRSYELSVFSDSDPKLQVIKFALKTRLKQLLDEGLQWVITGGQLGIEQWTIEVCQSLKEDYPQLQVALITPFIDFGKQWQENNQLKLATLKQTVDFFASCSKRPYENPQQLKIYQQFMLNHTDGALLVYDLESPGKSQYDYQAIQNYQTKNPAYEYQPIDFFELQDLAGQLNDMN